MGSQEMENARSVKMSLKDKIQSILDAITVHIQSKLVRCVVGNIESNTIIEI
jgi:hypothetical protein